MSYAEGRLYYDADSHIMETSNWLVEFADPHVRDLLRPLYLGGAGKESVEFLAQIEAAGETSNENELMTAKGWGAMGAIDAKARSRALDLLGFDAQLVFSTFAATQFAGGNPDLVYGGARAHNRGMAAFCGEDQRLLGVGYVPWGEPELVIKEAAAAIDDGCAAIMVDSAPPRDISPFHLDYEPLWALLEERNVPFVLHVGGGGSTVRRSFWKNGRAKPTDMFGGGESIRSKDYVTFHQAPEAFLSIMVLDGVLERFPNLQGGCIEQGATWVPGMIERINEAQRMFARTEPDLKALPLSASDYVRRQLWFTPFSGEAVEDLIDQAGEDLFMFSSDYPHPEGGTDPLGKFRARMKSASANATEKFYSGNFASMMGASLCS
jgi:predicted TIM-barrel fold metal-dependent hydrolase